MLKKHAQFFKSLFIISDMVVIGLAWLLSYVLRFHLAPLHLPCWIFLLSPRTSNSSCPFG